MLDRLEIEIFKILKSVDYTMPTDIEAKSKLLHEIVELYKAEVLNEHYKAGTTD